MKKDFFIIIVICILSLTLTACSNNISPKDYEQLKYEIDKCTAKYKALEAESPPGIKSFVVLNQYGDIIEPKDGWIKLSSQSTVKISLKGTATKVDLYTAPTGTDAYMLQQLVGTKYVESDIVELKLNVPEDFIGRVWAIAYNGDVARKSKDINVIFEKN